MSASRRSWTEDALGSAGDMVRTVLKTVQQGMQELAGGVSRGIVRQTGVSKNQAAEVQNQEAEEESGLSQCQYQMRRGDTGNQQIENKVRSGQDQQGVKTSWVRAQMGQTWSGHWSQEFDHSAVFKTSRPL